MILVKQLEGSLSPVPLSPSRGLSREGEAVAEDEQEWEVAGVTFRGHGGQFLEASTLWSRRCLAAWLSADPCGAVLWPGRARRSRELVYVGGRRALCPAPGRGEG